jgi:beta-galactosidase
MRKEIVFGTAYYPEYLPKDQTEEDLRLMKRAGMNAVRIGESTWSTLEPEDGVFDFSYIDRVLKAAKELEMDVIVGTPTYAVPPWLVRKHPGVMVERKSGKAHYGHRQLMDITSSDFQHFAESVIRKMVEHTAGHPRVIGFQIDNETKHYDGYGEGTQKLFRKYLQETFGTVERLNQAFYLAYWSNSIHSWDDFPDMRGCVNGGLASEYDRFRRGLVTKYLSWQGKLVREYAREDQFVTHNLDFQWKKFGADIAQDGYSYGVQPDADHEDIAGVVDLVGTDIYHPTQDELTGAEISFCGDEIRSLKGKNYLVLEAQAQAFKYWTPYPGQLRLHAFSHLASGAMGLMYWNWHSIHNGYEAYWKGILSHDLTENPVYEEAAVIGEEWKRIGAERLVIEKKNSVAILVDNLSLKALEWYPIDKDLTYNDVVRHMYDSLYEMNGECDVVFAHKADFSAYGIVIVPAMYCAGEEVLLRLEEFVKNGGILIATFRSFVADERLSIYPETLPHILYQCFGVRYNQFTEPGKTKVEGRLVKYWADLLYTEGAQVIARYEHPYWSKYAAVTEHGYGKGKAYYIGTFVEKDVVKDIYRRAFRDAGLELCPVQFPVIVKNGVNAMRKKIHYWFHFSGDKKTVNCPYERVIDLFTGKRYGKGEVMEFKDWDLMVLEEEITSN